MKIGDVWNGWTVDSFIGEGSFGKVYRVVKNEFDHTYESAIKVIRIPQSRAEEEAIRNEGMTEQSITTYYLGMVKDIVSEFTLMSELRGNSNIVSYEDHSVTELEDGFGWEIAIRMELLTPLFDYLKDHTLTVHDVIRLGIDMCKALETCQRDKIIHRDIKPANIFVAKQGNFKLGDFGIARQMDKTSAGMSQKGTYSYMAPEVSKNLPYNATVDIYSLGIVLYQFLNNNRTPFLPPFPDQIRYTDKEDANNRRICGEPIPPPCCAEGPLAAIILKACAYDPNDRIKTPKEMRKALEAVDGLIDGERIVYPPSEQTNQTEDSLHADGEQVSAAPFQQRFDAPEETEQPEPTVVPAWRSPAAHDTEQHDTEQHDTEQVVSFPPPAQGAAFTGDYPSAPRPDYPAWQEPPQPGYPAWQEPPQPNNPAWQGPPQTGGVLVEKPKQRKRPILIIIGAVAVAAIIAVIAAITLLGGDRSESSDQDATTANTTETTTAAEEATAEETVIKEDVDNKIPIHSMDLDFSNSLQENADGTVSFDNIMLMTNNSGYDITGIAYNAITEDGSGEAVRNKDGDCKDGALFYAEGYIPAGGTGVMVSKMTIAEDDFEKINPSFSGQRLKPRSIEVDEAYVFRGESDYRQPAGKLSGPEKDGEDIFYSVRIDNENDSPVHEGAKIVAVKVDDDDSHRIRVSSAKGEVNQEIPAECEDFAIKSTFKNPGLEDWPAKDYDVYVIDPVYADGSQYDDDYTKQYAK